MRKTFEIIGIFSLTFFSFFITDKTMKVVKEEDEIMISIKQNYDNFKRKSVNAIISKKTIIPGISSRKVNINKSYQAMREKGQYDESLYVYDYKKPKINIDNHLDKIIVSGNKTYRLVSISILLDSDSDVSHILSILDQNHIKANFFVNEDWLFNHNDIAVRLIKSGYVIGINQDMDYGSSEVKWMDTIIKKVGRQKKGYCLYKNQKSISGCQNLGNYTVKPLNIDNNYLLSVESNLSNGNIYLFKDSSIFEEELPSIIRYITSKGYSIITLDKMLKE